MGSWQKIYTYIVIINLASTESIRDLETDAYGHIYELVHKMANFGCRLDKEVPG